MPSRFEHAPQSKSKLWIVGAALLMLNGIFLVGLWYHRTSSVAPELIPVSSERPFVGREMPAVDPTAPDSVVNMLKPELAALRAAGMPAEARDVNVFYVVPAGVTDTADVWINAIQVVRSANLAERGKYLPIFGSGTSPIPVPGQPWVELDASRKLLAECAAEMQAIRKAAAAGGQGRFPVDFSAGSATPLAHMQDARQVARVLDLDAWVSAHDGNGAQALEDVKGIFALSNALCAEPIFISQMVRIAVYAVACDTAARLVPHCSWNDADLQSLQSAVQSADFKGDMARACRGERAMCVTELNSTIPGGPHQESARDMLRLFENLINTYSDSWPNVLARQNELTAEANRLEGLLQGLPSIKQATAASARTTARQRCLAAAIAVQRYRLRHNQLPSSLAEVKELFASGPATEAENLADPFDGKPLRYKPEEKRFVIYSVGVNQTDDGGDVLDYSQLRPQQGLDIGVIIQP